MPIRPQGDGYPSNLLLRFHRAANGNDCNACSSCRRREQLGRSHLPNSARVGETECIDENSSLALTNRPIDATSHRRRSETTPGTRSLRRCPVGFGKRGSTAIARRSRWKSTLFEFVHSSKQFVECPTIVRYRKSCMVPQILLRRNVRDLFAEVQKCVVCGCLFCTASGSEVVRSWLSLA